MSEGEESLYCYGLRFLVTMGSRPSIIARHGRYSHCHEDIFMDLFVDDFLSFVDGALSYDSMKNLLMGVFTMIIGIQ